MSFPYLLFQALSEEVSHFSQSKLQKAYSELTQLYRNNRINIDNSLNSAEKRISYIAARMPATFGAISRVLEEIDHETKEKITSLLDLGAGPGTAAWAACEAFPNLTNVTLIEREVEMLLLGQRLAKENNILKNANWLANSMEKAIKEANNTDLIVASYSFNEIPKDKKSVFLKDLWEKTNHILILVDPGSKESFSSLHEARSWFLSQNAHILAPCSHTSTCPAFANNDWCHFSTRIQRSSLHRVLKEGERGFEDEKFSYLIISKQESHKLNSRIIRHPEMHSGHLKLQLCTAEGFVQKVYSKKNGDEYKKAKKSLWGDAWELSH
ncbi:small ribosomal subunit Rsm22 family protein [Fluviispira multicolorata]|uniref:Methyltransferase domain-containing protein n=1 Tax=Fluviispira multicolorata TaxID=2654512 RepID=A0A833JES1_9BACT|nr:small ribosomal subunit Rsm22 family protein [Fluviispira multicolorata]KAB8030614.1 methyltransferase domain-containing protein [Fluviispira multicolorata]